MVTQKATGTVANQTCGGAATQIPASWLSVVSPPSLPQTISQALPGGTDINFRVTPPANTAAGNYTGAVNLTTTDGGAGPFDLCLTVNAAPTAAPTTLSVNPASGTYGGTTNLSAKLTKTSDSTNVSGKTISFSLRGTSVCDNDGTTPKPDCPTTDASGVATLTGVSLSGINAGGPTGTGYAGAVSASFAGDSGFGASSGSNSLTVNKATPTIDWNNPAAITYGTALSSTQLNAQAKGVDGNNLAGTYTYTPPSGTKLDAGDNQNLKVDFTPTDASNYTTATKTVQINVNKATPTIDWSNPADITFGTALSSTQLNAQAKGVDGNNLGGSYNYTPNSGTKLNAGDNQDLKVDFTPTDASNYKAATKTVQINVNKATPTIDWNNPADITFGTALGSTQLNAQAKGVDGNNLDGTYNYTPNSGTKLNAGPNQDLKVDFTPNDAANYKAATKTVKINVTYGFSGYLQPINDTAHQPQTGVLESKFKLGQTIPVKFNIYNAAGIVVQQATAPTFTKVSHGPCDSQTEPEAVTTETPNPGAQFVWTTDHYQYNWNTKGLSAGEYRIHANLADGTGQLNTDPLKQNYTDICLTK